MGDIADYHYDIALIQCYEKLDDVQTIVDNNNDIELISLIKETECSNDLVNNIIDYYAKYQKLSIKQKWVLSNYIYDYE